MDGFGIVYLIDNAQQFWSELEDILKIPGNASLSLLDATLKRSIAFGASYHEQYLQSPLQLEHACNLIFDSELFAFHSERMCEILTDEAAMNTDPHAQFILFSILLLYGRRNPSFLRSYKRWQPLFPLLMDHVLVDIDPDIGPDVDVEPEKVSSSTGWKGLAIAIEARLRSLSVRLLYEVCRSSKLTIAELKVFNDSFLDKLFDLVEQTRSMHDEKFNYSVIKLIISLNEQFMVAELAAKPQSDITNVTNSQNRVLHVLTRRHGTSQTFGENLIFMLNRASRTPEDLVMQLLVLKMLYILFNTKGLSEYFYTNDLRVLVDVFLREIVDLDEESESLRHTYLRVLHPLLTKTQLRSLPHKRPHIVRALESLVAHETIREVNSTTKRLVDRCLSGEWCVQHRTPHNVARVSAESGIQRTESPSCDRVAAQSLTPKLPSAPAPPCADPSISRRRSIKGSRSAENLRGLAATNGKPASRGLEVLRKSVNDSSLHLASATPPPAATARRHRDRTGSETLANERSADPHPRPHSPGLREVSLPVRHNSVGTLLHEPTPASPLSPGGCALAVPPAQPQLSPMSVRSFDGRVPPSPAGSAVSATSVASGTKKKVQRRSPPAPPKRRKPPAVPMRVGMTNGGAEIAAIASSTSAPVLGKVGKV